MATGDQQQQVGEGDIVGQPRRQGMAFQMVDGDEGFALDGGNGLCRHGADNDTADQAWAAGCRDAIQLGKAQAGLRHGSGDQFIEMIEMAAGGHFRHHAAEGAMLIEL